MTRRPAATAWRALPAHRRGDVLDAMVNFLTPGRSLHYCLPDMRIAAEVLREAAQPRKEPKARKGKRK